MDPAEPIPLGELCRRLDVPYRQARYVLERGLLPEGVDPSPDRGHHRRLTPAQAFWLGIVLRLKLAAVQTPLAARVADFAARAVRAVSRNANWDPRFAPFAGDLETQYRWYVDVGDLRYIRLVTDSCPSWDGLYEFPWLHVDRPEEAPGAAPAVLIRVDLGLIARRLRGPAGPGGHEESQLIKSGGSSA
jgi:hypothetical protein